MSDDRDDALQRLLRLDLELPERGTGARSARARARGGAMAPDPDPEPVLHGGPSRRWMAAFSALLVLAVVAGSALAYLGVQTVRDSTAGRTVSTTTDPSAPGFEALLEPTPTLLVVHEVDGSLASLALLALGSGDAGGSVLLVPPGTWVATEGYEGPLTVAYAFGGGVDAIFGHVERLLGIGIAGHVVVDDARWAVLTAGAAPIPIDNPDEVEGFDAGPIELAAADVGRWLAPGDDDEAELARLFRQQLFWDAWLRKVAAAGDPAVVPGEIDSGIGRFVRGLAAGPQQIATLPVVEDTGSDGKPIFQPQEAAAAELVSRLVPFPRGSWEGARTRVRLLDGTGTIGHALVAAPTLVRAGAAIVIVGNAESFDHSRTEVRYHDPSQAGAAERLADALGVDQVVEDARLGDAFDVTIVLGEDI